MFTDDYLAAKPRAMPVYRTLVGKQVGAFLAVSPFFKNRQRKPVNNVCIAVSPL